MSTIKNRILAVFRSAPVKGRTVSEVADRLYKDALVNYPASFNVPDDHVVRGRVYDLVNEGKIFNTDSFRKSTRDNKSLSTVFQITQ